MIEWDIVRSEDPGSTHRGKALPIFIHNSQHFLTTLDVYDDGVVFCWQFVDLALLDEKLSDGWIVTQPPEGVLVCIHNLGMARAMQAQWTLGLGDLRARVHAIVKELNPSMTGLVNMRASERRQSRGTAADVTPVRHRQYPARQAGESMIAASTLPVFLRVGDAYHQTHWFIFADGVARFGPDGSLMPFEDSCERIRRGDVATGAPSGSRIVLQGLGSFTAADSFRIPVSERLREAADELAKLRGDSGTVVRCILAFEAFEKSPSEDAREALRQAYFAVPKHLRVYCGDMDSKDFPIRKALNLGRREEDPA